MVELKKTTLILGIIATFAVLLANLAILPTLVPGYLVEGATPPTDVSEVVAASDLLKMTALALVAMAVIVEKARSARTAPLLFLCACTVVALTVFRAKNVVAIILVWAPHVRGEQAAEYWAAVAAMAATLIPAVYLIVT